MIPPSIPPTLLQMIFVKLLKYVRELSNKNTFFHCPPIILSPILHNLVTIIKKELPPQLDF